jgi:hypothetical protein
MDGLGEQNAAAVSGIATVTQASLGSSGASAASLAAVVGSTGAFLLSPALNVQVVRRGLIALTIAAAGAISDQLDVSAAKGIAPA